MATKGTVTGGGKRRVKATPRADDDVPDRWLVVLEQIQQQNRATIEAVYAVRDELIQRFEARFDSIETRLTALEIAVRQHTETLRVHSEILRAHSTELRGLRADVDRLSENVDRQDQRERIDALERRIERLESGTG